MSIRFKFRSSVNFDSVDIDGKPSISVRDLRSKIVLQKHLNFCQDFDLVFSDALTGQEYNDEKFLIPSGSSVIIKRVPAETVPPAQLRDQKLEASDLSEAIPKGSNHNRGEEIIPQEKPESEFEEHMKLEKVSSANFIDLQSAGLPSELKCSLCNTFFKEAVMIPCCQHSFCQKCISQVLIAKARCPKCSASKCRAEDLLPNLSLRHAIEHFLESQILTTGPDNALREYAPDGESGIHAKEVSCAVTVTKRNLDLRNSSSATDKGSNQIAESFYKSMNRKNASLEGSGYHVGNLNAVGALKSAPSLLRVKHIDGERDGPEDLAAAADSQGENQPINLPQAHVPDEADSTIRKRRLWVDPRGGGQSFVVAGRNKKADRTCYMCGSPDHFIRDCPVASTPHPMYQTGDSMFQGGMQGYAMPYWSGAAFPPIRPYMNMYGNPGMVPFNANMVPVSPYAVPQYMPSVYGGLHVGGIMRMGGLAPPVRTRAERPSNHSEFLDFRDCDNRRKLPNEQRGHPCDHEDDDFHKRHRYHELERSAEYKSHTEREKSVSNSEDSHGKKLRRTHHGDKHLDHNIKSVDERPRSAMAGKDWRSCHSERSNSGVEDMPNSTDRYSEARQKQRCRSSKKHHENRGQSGSDSSWSRHQSKKERYAKRSVESDVRDFQHKHKSHSSSGLEPSSSGDQKKRSKDIEYTRGLRESRNRTNPIADELCSDRWQMVNGSDEDSIEGYHHRKRKRGL